MKRKPKYYNLVKETFNPNIETGISEWKTREELISAGFPISSNGNTRQGIFCGVKAYKWEFERRNNNKSGRIDKIRTIGNNEYFNTNHPIRIDIRNYYKGCKCIVCGNSDIIIDHKNDLYNDPRVLNEETQKKEDFQPLCNSCNLRKRQVCKKSKETNKRYKATNIPILAVFGIDFIQGDENLDLSNPNAMVGTYWYDPLAFMNYIKKNPKKKKIFIKKKNK